MKKLIQALRRNWAYWTMRSIEINLAGMVDTLPFVRCELTRQAMRLQIKAVSRDLCKARAHYQSFLPVGQRRTWVVA